MSEVVTLVDVEAVLVALDVGVDRVGVVDANVLVADVDVVSEGADEDRPHTPADYDLGTRAGETS